MKTPSKAKTPAKKPAPPPAPKLALTNFTLKRASKSPTSRTYVDPTKNVTAQQAESINRQLPNLNPTGPGIRIITSVANPLGMDSRGSIELDTLIQALETAMTGTQFYTASTSIADKMAVQQQIDTFFAKLKAQNNVQSE